MNVESVAACLPQTQCQLCGYPDCQAYAKAVVAGEQLHLCQPGGEKTLRKLEQVCRRKAQSRPLPYQEHVVVIDEELCIGCYKCVRACPAMAIVGIPKNMHTVLAADCTGCDLCIPVCPVDCIAVVPTRATIARACDSVLRQLYDERKLRYEKQQATRQKREKMSVRKIVGRTEKQRRAAVRYQQEIVIKAMKRCARNKDRAGLKKLRQQLMLLDKTS